MTRTNHKTYTFELPQGWLAESAPADNIPLYMLYLREEDKNISAEDLDAVGSISDFTAFARDDGGPIELYDLVETFESWAHLRKLKFEEPVEFTRRRETIEFEVIGTAEAPDGRRHFVWLLGNRKTVVRVHFVVSKPSKAMSAVVGQVIALVESVRLV